MRACPGIAVDPPTDLFALSTAECQTPEEIGGRLLSTLAGEAEPDSRLREAAPAHDSPEWRRVEEELRRGSALWGRRSESFLDADVLAELFPRDVLRSSVSRLESFARCPVQHLANSILRLEARDEAEISPLATGLLAHAVLEAVFRRAELPRPGQAETLVTEAMRALERHPDFLAFHLDPASRHRWDSVRHSLAQYLEIEAERLSKSRYRPHAFEVAFGPEEGNAVVLPLSGGARLELRGRLDRLDRAEIDGEARGLVLDYKSRGRTRVARHWREGRDLQLGVYLLFVDQVLGWKPAGGLYVPVLPAPIAEEKVGANDNRIALKFSGVVPESEREAIDGGLNVLPSTRSGDLLKENGALPELLDRAREHLTAYAGTLRRGWIEARPSETERRLPCDTCDYLAVCRHRPGRDPARLSPREGMDAPTPTRGEA
ncbi:MAG: PD-(D/E)XK nuclease family protein [Candidatus Eisenbacteria bacterium]